jgi:hypothetical protein
MRYLEYVQYASLFQACTSFYLGSPRISADPLERSEFNDKNTQNVLPLTASAVVASRPCKLLLW